jgi:hypothetical protein
MVGAVVCDYCSQPAPLVTGKEVFPHRPDLWEKKFYQCKPCDAHVGCHPAAATKGGGMGDGTVPLGRLANPELRRAKTAAHAAFDPIWRTGPLKRREAYVWLSQQLRIPFKDCHIGMFDLDQCRAVVAACLRHHNEEASQQ